MSKAEENRITPPYFRLSLSLFSFMSRGKRLGHSLRLDVNESWQPVEKPEIFPRSAINAEAKMSTLDGARKEDEGVAKCNAL